MGVVILGRASDIAERGAFFTHDATGVPLLVVRDLRERVNVMLNVCRHRGTRLVDAKRGVATSFVCPLHAWTYDLEGQFMSPEAALPRFPSAVRHGFVWVDVDARTIDVAAALGDLDARFAALRVDEWRVESRSEREATDPEMRGVKDAFVIEETSITHMAVGGDLVTTTVLRPP